MTLNDVYNADDNTLSLNEEELKFITELQQAFPFQLPDLITRYLSGTAEEISTRRARLEIILTYYRSLGGREARYFFPPDLAERVFELMRTCKIKPTKSDRQQAHYSLEQLFYHYGEENALVFRNEIIPSLLTDNGPVNLLHIHWKKRLKSIVFILTRDNTFKPHSSPILANIFNDELAELIARSREQSQNEGKNGKTFTPLHIQTFQETKMQEVTERPGLFTRVEGTRIDFPTYLKKLPWRRTETKNGQKMYFKS